MRRLRWEEMAAKYVKENFDWKVVIKKYTDFFEEIGRAHV